MARVHRTDLTDKMKERLARCEKKYLEKNGGDDSTRLIDSWYGANEEEKTMLKELLKLDRKFYSSVANVKNKHYETFGVFTNKVLSSTIQNIKNAEKLAQARVSEGMLCCFFAYLSFFNRIQWLTLSDTTVREEQEAAAGPFASGVKAKSTTTKPPSTEYSKKTVPKASSAASIFTKAGATFNGQNYNADNGTVVGGKAGAAGGASVARSIFAGSFNGKPIPQDGTFGGNGPQILPSAVFQIVNEAIGGGLIFGQADFHIDAARNKRGSLRLCYSPLCIIPEEGGVDVRLSTRDPSIVIAQVEIAKEFCQPDKVLDYILDRMKEACPQLQSKAARLSYLRNTSRYSALFGNLQKLYNAFNQSPTSSKSIRFEYRIQFKDDNGLPFKIASTLVRKDEDNLFYGVHNKLDKRGTTHVFYEFKEKDAPFRLVDHSGTRDFSIGNTSPFGKTPMSPLNEEESDDDMDDGPPATITTPMKEAMKKGAAKARASNVSASYRDNDAVSSDGSTLPSVEDEAEMEIDDDEESSSGESTVSEKTKELIETFTKTLKHSRKKKNSTFGIGTSDSHRSGTTRGDTAREEKRKGKAKSHNDNSSKASSKRSTKSKSNATSYSCFKKFDDETKKHD